MNKSPAFQFYPQDYLSSSRVAEMTLEEEGAYIRLICYCWTTGSIPADPVRCAKLAGKGCSIETATVVQRAFNESSTDPQRLVHNRLEIERENQRLRRAQASNAGKKSAAKRAKLDKNTVKTGDFNDRSTTVQREVNTSSSSSDEDVLPSARESDGNKRITFHVPTIEEIQEYAIERGIDVDAEEFWNFYDSKNWMVGKNKMQKWKSCISGWAARNKPKKKDVFAFMRLPEEEREAFVKREMFSK